MKTAIVILNWNGRGFLEKYLPSVVSSLQGNDQACVVVADNGSTDDSLAFLEANFPSVKTIALKKNYGFAEGYNKALDVVDRELGAKYCLLLNSDVEVPDGWLEPLVEWMDLHDDCGICGPKLHQIGERDMFEYAGAAGGYLDRFGYPLCRGRVMKSVEKDCGQYDIPADVMWVSGAALMIRASLFRELKGFSKDFFAHMEEIDLCWRARLGGWKVSVVPRSVVYHVGGGSLPQDSPRKLMLNYRNNLLMLEHNLACTLAVHNMFAVLENATAEDEGPDIFHVCMDVLEDEGSEFKEDLCKACSALACRQARFKILGRMFLDGLSAMAYLAQMRPAAFKAVWDAHNQYKRLKRKHRKSKKAVNKYLHSVLKEDNLRTSKILLTADGDCDNYGSGPFRIKGMWSKWVVWQSLVNKKNIFTDIKNNII